MTSQSRQEEPQCLLRGWHFKLLAISVIKCSDLKFISFICFFFFFFFSHVLIYRLQCKFWKLILLFVFMDTHNSLFSFYLELISLLLVGGGGAGV